jgi:hypothetical protein
VLQLRGEFGFRACRCPQQKRACHTPYYTS